jgi:hypothetical protein
MAHRRSGSRNWARGVLATFWILLAGVSGLYLFTAFTDPTLGGQLVRLGPAASGETTSALTGSAAGERELAEIKASLQQLTRQVAALSAHLNLDLEETPPAASSDSAAQAPPPPPAPAEDSEAADAGTAAAETEAPEAGPPEAQPAPVEQAASEAPEPAPPVQAEAPAAPEPDEPPPVAVAPLPPPEEAQHVPAADAPPSPPAPAETAEAAEAAEEAESSEPASPEPAPEVTESAALDPVALPPAANDGSTRYGIEIGTVAKPDGLRPLWREFLTNHAALVAGLQPRRVLAPDKSWRLIAGPFASAAEAEQACALFKKASRPCEATVYAGDAL